MTDQDWEVDGAPDGRAGEGSGADASCPDLTDPAARCTSESSITRAVGAASSSRSANVVPFPGNWFGSVDELVPVHPEPRSSAMGPAAPAGEPPAAFAADASDFWEGDADALAEVSTAEPQSSIALLRSSGAWERNRTARGATATANSGSARNRDERLGPARPLRERTIGLRSLAVVVLASAAGGVLLATHALSGDVGSRIARRPAQSGVVSPRHTARVVTQTVTTRVAETTHPARKHRRRATTARVHKGTGPTSQKPPETAASTSAAETGSAAPTLSTGAAVSPAHDSPAVSNPDSSVASNHASTTSRSTPTGCAVQSPDSGCLP